MKPAGAYDGADEEREVQCLEQGSQRRPCPQSAGRPDEVLASRDLAAAYLGDD